LPHRQHRRRLGRRASLRRRNAWSDEHDRRAERIQLAAHRGGVETGNARAELDSAIDNQIELETLVHTFGAAEVQKKQKEGLGHARAALLSAQRSLEELGYRRRGLFVALGIIIAVLVALAIKIRTL